MRAKDCREEEDRVLGMREHHGMNQSFGSEDRETFDPGVFYLSAARSAASPSIAQNVSAFLLPYLFEKS